MKDIEEFKKLDTEFKCVKQQAKSTKTCLDKCTQKDSADKRKDCNMKCIVEHIPQAVKCFHKP